LFTQTNAGNASNRTDIYAAPAVSATGGASTLRAAAAATPSATSVSEAFVVTPELQQRVSDNLIQAMRSRLPGAQQR
jgi:hypothetical protein